MRIDEIGVCPCCGEQSQCLDLKEKLSKLSERIGKDIIVTSGYRCRKHNQQVGGSTNSFHLREKAADIFVEGVPLEQLAKEAKLVGFHGIGIYKKHLHVDTRDVSAEWRTSKA